ncbi:MAG TPA: phosphatase PAP2 family protein [Acetobacteraceae bacterium]|nr:phosphatase PAP2 family protein [Acetobacteraceae bacterium]
MMFLTDFADQAVILPVVFAVAIVLAMQGWRYGALVWLGVVFATFGLMLVLKLVFLACAPLRGPIDIHSPSGHVAAATVVSGGLAALLTRRRATILPIAMLAAVAIGVSRLVLGMHSLPEVVLGALVGLAGAAALLTLAGAPSALRPGRLLAVVVIVAALFHGMHLPAEAAIRHTAFHAAQLLSVCQPPAGLDARGVVGTTLPRPAR